MAKNKKQSEKKEKNPKKKKNETDKFLQTSEETTSNETNNQQEQVNEANVNENSDTNSNDSEEIVNNIPVEEETGGKVEDDKADAQEEAKTEYVASVKKEKKEEQPAAAEIPSTEREKNPDINAQLEIYIKKNETTSISDYTLNGMGLKEEHYTGLTSIHFGKYSIKRANPNAQTWAIVNNVEGM